MFKTAERQFTYEDAQNLCGGLLKEDSFYSILGNHGHHWICDDDYAQMYREERGRPCVPPSLLVRSLFLQNYRACSDRELVDRIRFDLRYKVALGVPVDDPGFDASLLAVFRARLILHDKEGAAFDRSIELAKQSGLIKGFQAIDSMPTKGAAALQDTYTLLRTALEKLLAAIREQRDAWSGSRGFRYPFSNKKYQKGNGKANIDWSDPKQRQRYLDELVRDAAAIVEAVDNSKMKDSELVKPSCDLLKRILAQDIETDDDGQPKIRRGGTDRILNTNDPEARHGRKSSCRLIRGYKTHVTVSEDEIVTSVAVTPANAPDTAPVGEMVNDLDKRGVKPKQLYGDCAYGGGDFRAAMRSEDVEVVAKLPKPAASQVFPKRAFEIDVANGNVTCPAGERTTEWRQVKDDKKRFVQLFVFSPEQCQSCDLREQCISPSQTCRSVQLHYNESELQAAQDKVAEPDFAENIKRRLVVERVQARLQSYGLGCSRYFGKQKTLLQARITAAVNNLWRTCTRGPTFGLAPPLQEAT
jgi:hypothetical protein